MMNSMTPAPSAQHCQPKTNKPRRRCRRGRGGSKRAMNNHLPTHNIAPPPAPLLHLPHSLAASYFHSSSLTSRQYQNAAAAAVVALMHWNNFHWPNSSTDGSTDQQHFSSPSITHTDSTPEQMRRSTASSKPDPRRSAAPHQQQQQHSNRKLSHEKVLEAEEDNSACSYSIFIPEANSIQIESAPSSTSEDPQSRQQIKKVTFQDDLLSTDDPAYNWDLKRAEHVATIPATLTQEEVMQDIDCRLELAAHLWDGLDDEDEILQEIVDSYGLLEKHSLVTSRCLPFCSSKDYERGTYPSVCSLPLMQELQRQHADHLLRLRLHMALQREPCVQAMDPISSQSVEQCFQQMENDPPAYLVHWGLVQDPSAAKRRQREKLEEEKGQDMPKEAAPSSSSPRFQHFCHPSMHQLSPSKWNNEQRCRGVETIFSRSSRPIVKTSHLVKSAF